jgi:hypothetical protein
VRGETAGIGAAPSVRRSHRSAGWRVLRMVAVALIAAAIAAGFAGTLVMLAVEIERTLGVPRFDPAAEEAT